MKIRQLEICMGNDILGERGGGGVSWCIIICGLYGNGL